MVSLVGLQRIENFLNKSLMTSRIRALVTTIEPIDGGVPSMTRWICSLLEELDIVPVLAWYAPWSKYPDLSVPLYRILLDRPKTIRLTALSKYEAYGVGAWFPELEFTHYLPSKNWKSLIRGCQLHVVVSGNPLPASAFALMDLPFLAWVATPWEADRKDRIKGFSKLRRALDTFINKPILRQLEKVVLRAPKGRILTLSRYTSREFEEIGGRSNKPVMLMPVNTELFKRRPEKTICWRIGFSGRYSDPRKNIGLLLNATSILVAWGFPVEVILVGDRNNDNVQTRVAELMLNQHVKCYGHKQPEQLSDLLQSFDLFVIPSHQEGLCISALEAMACGVPVVSTRCGGPEDFVIDEQTGQLITWSPSDLASTIREICLQRDKRERLSQGAERWVLENASDTSSKEKFLAQIEGLKRDSLAEKQMPRDKLSCMRLNTTK